MRPTVEQTRQQVRQQVDTSLYAIEHLVENPPDKWLERNLCGNDRLGYDPWLHTVDGAERIRKGCAAAGATPVAVESNPIDEIWTDRPAPPLGPVSVHDLRFAGEPAEQKLSRIAAELAARSRPASCLPQEQRRIRRSAASRAAARRLP